MRSLRFSIGGLMGVVLLAAIGFAGVANPTGPWVGTVSLLTHGTIYLAIVGAICRSGAERVWWLGFASFGWMYMDHPFFFSYSPYYPTQALLRMLAPLMGIPIRANGNIGNDDPSQAFFQIGQCLWAIVAAIIGGFLASALFSAGAAKSEEAAMSVQPPGLDRRRWWEMPSAVVLCGLGLTIAIGVVCAPLEPGIWAGATYLLTWWLLALTALGAVFAKGRRRECWLGAAFLGVSFMFVVFNRPYYFDPRDQPMSFPTVQLLEAIRPRLEVLAASLSGNPNSTAAKNARILKALNQPVPMRFDEGTTLRNLLKYVRDATKGPDGKGIPIYVDPIGLQEAEKSTSSTFSEIDIDGVALRTSLGFCLRQLDLGFGVRDGLLVITSIESEDMLAAKPYDDPFQIVGHCFLALIAAGLGGVAAPLVCDLGRERRA
jgi:hypothetical protein